MANYKFTSTRNQYAVQAGRRIKLARDQLQMTQATLSEATGGTLAEKRIANWEQGTREPGIREAIILGKALKQPPAFLLGLVDEIDRDMLTLPVETKVALLSALRTSVT